MGNVKIPLVMGALALLFAYFPYFQVYLQKTASISGIVIAVVGLALLTRCRGIKLEYAVLVFASCIMGGYTSFLKLLYFLPAYQLL
ncbi:hypothetical protein MM300_11035 [Evansella sp. LMS18]|uniref:hypothetical protein n=1 Tax=Evansella sp. LMS18 TaxID=2924033 RepID=UPI0020D0907B|nr:hypothetical protein [Evansella sp. LMS18]UTR12767.1 hypothetical protein MM300_11035 [Evansella sp. LMS18]